MAHGAFSAVTRLTAVAHLEAVMAWRALVAQFTDYIRFALAVAIEMVTVFRAALIAGTICNKAMSYYN